MGSHRIIVNISTLDCSINTNKVNTVKPETLTSQNFDEFGEPGSNCQTLTFQSKVTKQNKRLQII